MKRLIWRVLAERKYDRIDAFLLGFLLGGYAFAFYISTVAVVARP